MSRGTFPIITCDYEVGCDQWTLDYYEALCDNWRSLMAEGWQYDPYARDKPHLCPEHAAASD